MLKQRKQRPVEPGVPETAGLPEPLPEVWVNRRQASTILGVPGTTLRRLEGRELHPVRREDGQWWFRLDEVLELCSKPIQPEEPAIAEGELTAAAFALFEEGKSVREVVIALKQPARVVRALKDEHEELGGGIDLRPQHLAELVQIVGGAPKTAGELIAALRSRLKIQYELGYGDGVEASEAGNGAPSTQTSSGR